MDEGISVVAAILKACKYFVGVDNGVKHLAWALGIPRTYITPYRMLTTQWILRYAPDYHRFLQVGDAVTIIQRHISDCKNAVEADAAKRR